MHSIFIDERGGWKDLISISDDYIVMHACLKYIACAMDASNPEHAKLSEITKNWSPVDIHEYPYDKALITMYYT